MNRGVEGLIRKFSRNAEQISIDRKALTVDTIEQTYYEVRNRSKIEVLCRILDLETKPRGIVFCDRQAVLTGPEFNSQALDNTGVVVGHRDRQTLLANHQRLHSIGEEPGAHVSDITQTSWNTSQECNRSSTTTLEACLAYLYLASLQETLFPYQLLVRSLRHRLV